MKSVRIRFHLIQIRDMYIPLNLIVAFDNADIHLVEKRFLCLKNCTGLIDELLHQLILARCGSIDCDHKLLNLLRLAVFVLLDQRHISIHRETIHIKSVIERIHIHRNLFPEHCKFL